MRRALTFLGLVMLLARPTFGTVESRPAPPWRDVGIDQRLGETLPLDLRFRDERGRDVRLGDLFAQRPVILTFAYSDCPMLCPIVLNGLVATLRTLPLEMGRDYDVVTVSIDPKETPHDALGKKNVYVNRYARAGAIGGWRFLTGEADAIASLTAAAGFRYVYERRIDQYAHAAGIVVVAPGAKIARYFYGVEFSARDLRLGLVEASEGRIGTLADQILLLCYHYDPETGTYGALALGLVRTGGALTVMVLGGFLFVMWRCERRAVERA